MNQRAKSLLASPKKHSYWTSRHYPIQITVIMIANVSYVMEFLVCWYEISLILSKIASKKIAVFCELTQRQVLKKWHSCTFKVNFLFQKTSDFFDFVFILEYQFRRPFFDKKTTLFYQIFYSLKLCPLFVCPTLCQFTRYSNFLEGNYFFC